jgi:hypothetical protein
MCCTIQKSNASTMSFHSDQRADWTSNRPTARRAERILTMRYWSSAETLLFASEVLSRWMRTDSIALMAEKSSEQEA